jgi:DNA-binding NarL/FixJ family response regulator
MAKKQLTPARSNSSMIRRVVLVEDHAIVRQGLVQMINDQADMEIVGQAADVPTGLTTIAKSKPNVVVVDITLKGGNGLELVKTVAAQDANLPMLILSMHPESMNAQAALRAGAMGYVMKDEDIAKVLLAMRQILSGKIYLSPEMVNRMIVNNIRGGPAATASPIELLSDREMQVFQLISDWKGPSQIARELNLSVKTVEYYREKIKEKLSLTNAAEIMQFAIALKTSENKVAA